MAYFVTIDNSHTNCLETESLSEMLGRTGLNIFIFEPRKARTSFVCRTKNSGRNFCLRLVNCSAYSLIYIP